MSDSEKIINDTKKVSDETRRDSADLAKVSSSDVSLIGQEKSTGVRKAEILAKQYTKWYHQVIILVSAFIVGYAYGLDIQTRYIYTAYASSSYSHHSLLTTIAVVSSVAQAVSQIVYARLSDVFGRLELFIVSTMFFIIGTIIQSQAYDIQRYCAGTVFYSIGYSGVSLVLLFILSDFSVLKWRLFYSFVPTFPFIINTWIAGNLTSAIGTRWSWGIGMWAFIFPLASIPFLGCMLHMRYLAGKTEEWKEFKQTKTKFQELGLWNFLVFLFWNLDVIGLVLFAVSLGCILVPLTIAGGVSQEWKTGHIIAPMVIGWLLVPVFLFWESKTKHAFAPLHLLKDRGIWSGLYISFSITFVSSIQSSYLYTVLIVAVNESIKSATRISSLSSFIGCVCGLFFGLIVVYVKRLKAFMIFGTCCWLVALGIMLKYRAGLNSHAGIIGAECLLGFGTTFFTYPVNVSMQSSVNHEHMAVITALGYSVYRVGSAIGSTIAGAIWTQLLYEKIASYMNNDTIAVEAFGSPFTFVVSYPWGTPERAALVHAYKDIQFILVLVAFCLCIPLIVATFFLRDHKLGELQSIDNIEQLENKDRITDFFRNFGRRTEAEKATDHLN